MKKEREKLRGKGGNGEGKGEMERERERQSMRSSMINKHDVAYQLQLFKYKT